MLVGSHASQSIGGQDLRPKPPAISVSRLLKPQDRHHWEAVLSRGARYFNREDIVRQGDRPGGLCVVLSGWVQRYKQTADGRRQIVALILPGEVCDLDLFTLARRESSLAPIGRASVAILDSREAISLFEKIPDLGRVITRSQIVGLAIRNEWLTSLGCRDALERVAHLLCELFLRQRGTRQAGICDFPMTQTQLAEATGITAVHVNRTLRRLCRSTAIVIRERRLIVPDFEALAGIAGFNGRYLHPGGTDLVEESARCLLSAAGLGQHARSAPWFEPSPRERTSAT